MSALVRFFTGVLSSTDDFFTSSTVVVACDSMDVFASLQNLKDLHRDLNDDLDQDNTSKDGGSSSYPCRSRAMSWSSSSVAPHERITAKKLWGLSRVTQVLRGGKSCRIGAPSPGGDGTSSLNSSSADATRTTQPLLAASRAKQRRAGRSAKPEVDGGGYRAENGGFVFGSCFEVVHNPNALHATSNLACNVDIILLQVAELSSETIKVLQQTQPRHSSVILVVPFEPTQGDYALLEEELRCNFFFWTLAPDRAPTASEYEKFLEILRSAYLLFVLKSQGF